MDRLICEVLAVGFNGITVSMLGNPEDIRGVEGVFYPHLDPRKSIQKLELQMSTSGATFIFAMDSESIYTAFPERLVIDLIQKNKTGIMPKAVRMEFCDENDFAILLIWLKRCVQMRTINEVVTSILADGFLPPLRRDTIYDQVVPENTYKAENDGLQDASVPPPVPSANVD